MMCFSDFFIGINVYGGLLGPPWGSDIGNDGFEIVHAFGEVFGDVYEVRWEGQLLPFGVVGSSDPWVQGVLGGGW